MKSRGGSPLLVEFKQPILLLVTHNENNLVAKYIGWFCFLDCLKNVECRLLSRMIKFLSYSCKNCVVNVRKKWTLQIVIPQYQTCPLFTRFHLTQYFLFPKISVIRGLGFCAKLRACAVPHLDLATTKIESDIPIEYDCILSVIQIYGNLKLSHVPHPCLWGNFYIPMHL